MKWEEIVLELRSGMTAIKRRRQSVLKEIQIST